MPLVSRSSRCGACSTSSYPSARRRDRRQSAFSGPMPGTVSRPWPLSTTSSAGSSNRTLYVACGSEAPGTGDATIVSAAITAKRLRALPRALSPSQKPIAQRSTPGRRAIRQHARRFSVGPHNRRRIALERRSHGCTIAQPQPLQSTGRRAHARLRRGRPARRARARGGRPLVGRRLPRAARGARGDGVGALRQELPAQPAARPRRRLPHERGRARVHARAVGVARAAAAGGRRLGAARRLRGAARRRRGGGGGLPLLDRRRALVDGALQLERRDRRGRAPPAERALRAGRALALGCGRRRRRALFVLGAPRLFARAARRARPPALGARVPRGRARRRGAARRRAPARRAGRRAPRRERPAPRRARRRAAAAPRLRGALASAQGRRRVGAAAPPLRPAARRAPRAHLLAARAEAARRRAARRRRLRRRAASVL